MSEGIVWETTDMGTAAFAHMRGLKILGVRRAEAGAQGNGRFVFRFEDPDDEGPKLQVEYLNSECRSFDSAVRSLKKLVYDNEGSRAARTRA